MSNENESKSLIPIALDNIVNPDKKNKLIG